MDFSALRQRRLPADAVFTVSDAGHGHCERDHCQWQRRFRRVHFVRQDRRRDDRPNQRRARRSVRPSCMMRSRTPFRSRRVKSTSTITTSATLASGRPINRTGPSQGRRHQLGHLRPGRRFVCEQPVRRHEQREILRQPDRHRHARRPERHSYREYRHGADHDPRRRR